MSKTPLRAMRRLALIATLLATGGAHAGPISLGLDGSLNLLAFTAGIAAGAAAGVVAVP